jgi:hypothetical protein
MSVTLFSSAQVYDSTLGEFVSDDHVRLARVINDYKPTLSLAYIPRKDRDASDTKPWAIVERDERFGEHVIRYLSDDEMKRPNEILAWIFAGDQDKHDKREIIARLDLEATAEEALRMQRDLDEREDHIEKLTFMGSGGRDHKHYFTDHRGRKIERR